MKVTQEKSGFQPVTITLETQEELDVFTEVFYRVGGNRVRDTFGSANTIFKELTSLGGKQTQYDSGPNVIFIN